MNNDGTKNDEAFWCKTIDGLYNDEKKKIAITKKEFKSAKLDIEDHFDESWEQCISDYLNGYSHYANIPIIGKHFPDIVSYLEENNPKKLNSLKNF